jgi:glycosyltransferase involved in cell wall biosynthesis
MRIAILTRSLTRGGAQVQVVTLSGELARRGHDVSVVVFYGGGALAARAGSNGSKVVDLRKSGRWSFLKPIRRLKRHLEANKTDVVYSFLAMENLFGLVSARLAHTPIVWGVRGAAVSRGQYGLASRVLYGLQFRLMRFADAVICNSRAAANEIPASRARALHVVPNGIDCDKFFPSAEARQAWRARHGFGEVTRVVGIVARLDPMKDHANFLQAAARASMASPGMQFVVAGSGPLRYEVELRELARQLGIADRILWLGEVAETVDVYRGIDLLVSSSAYGEGFSNAIGEAMACGVPAVATDVGDSGLVVGEHGKVVPPRAPDMLADAIVDLLARDDIATRDARRRRVVAEFGVATMVARTEYILGEVAARGSARQREA